MKKQLTLLFALIALITFSGIGQNPTLKDPSISDSKESSRSVSTVLLPACTSQDEITNAFESWKGDLLDFIFSFQSTEGCNDELTVSFIEGDILQNIPVCPGLYQNMIDLFPERANAITNPDTEHLFIEGGFDPADLSLVLDEESEVYVTFLWEGAGYKNTFGYYTYPAGSPPSSPDDLDLHILFENASMVGDGGDLLTGDTRQVGNSAFPAGTVVGFFLIADAWNSSTNEVGPGRHTVYTDFLLNPNGLQQHVLFQEDFTEGCGDLILSFEDILRPEGDKDFNDVMFIVRTKDTPIIPVISQLTAPSFCGGSVMVSWEYTSSCNPSQSGEASFVVSPLTIDDIAFDLPANIDQVFASQADLDAAFATWLSAATVTGGCPSATISVNPPSPEAPSVCGGSAEVEWIYEDDCVTFKQTRTFTAQSNLPEVTLEPFGSVCETTLLTLEGGMPAGGIYYVNGVETDVFDASLYGIGEQVITYVFENAEGCASEATQTITVKQNPCYEIQITPILCHDGNGMINVIVDPSCGSVSSISFTNLSAKADARNDDKGGIFSGSTTGPAGDYLITVTGVNGCVVTEVVTLINPDPFDVEITADGSLEFCEGNSVTLTATEGVSYLWSTGETTQSITVSTTDTYSVVVTDANTCTGEAEVNVTVFPNPEVSIVAENDAVLNCTFTQILLTAEGSTAGTYLWTGPGGFSETTESVSVSEPGLYEVLFTDGNTCTATNEITVTQDIEEPILTITGAETLTCDVTEVTLTANVDADVTVEWGDGTTGTTLVVSAPGTYTATATAPNGCTTTVSVDVDQDITPPALTITGNETLTCDVLEITLTANVDAGVTVEWGDGTTGTTLVVSAPGTYTATATAPNGCTTVVSATVDQDITPPSITITGNETLTCSVTSVTLTANVDAGVTVVWNDGTTGNTLTVTQPGTFTATATAPNGCVASLSETVVQDTEVPSLTITGNELLTCDLTEITLTAVTEPGVTVEWTGGSTGTTLLVTTPGVYTATATGINGCQSFASVTVEEDVTVPSISITGNELITCIVTEITLTVVVEPGVTVVWEDGSTSLSRTISEAGTYTATATHPVSGCQNTEVVVVEADNAPPVITFESFVVCHDAAAFVLDQASPAGGTYSGAGVVNGEFDASVAGIGAHEVTYSYTNPATGCSNTATATITVSSPIEITAAVTDLEVWGTGTGAISLTVTGGTPPYTYMWDNGETTATITGLQAGDYFVTVFDETGCFASQTITVDHNSTLVDLGITIEVNIQTPDPAEVDEIIFALVVTNHDQTEDATGVVVTNVIPEPFPFIVRLDDGTSGDYDPATGTWNIGTIPAGEWRLLVYRTEMLLVEADENDVKSQQSAVNSAQILPFDQIDPNLANNYAEIVVSVGESTSGDDNGIESNGSMAAQMALRNHRRLVESTHIPRQERAIKMAEFSRMDMLTGEIKTAKADGQHSTGIGMLLPETGPANTRAFISTPADLIGITNAKEIFSVDYLQENNARRAAILAISTDASSVYEHTKVICDRLVGAELRDIQMMEIAGRPFIMSKLVHPGGYIDYSVSFIAQQSGGQFVIDNRWYNEEYELLNTDDIFNFQVWSVTPQFTRQLVEEILETMENNGGVSFRNEEVTPQIPQVYVHSGRYTNGGLLLNLVNTNGASRITIYGSKTLYESGVREPMHLSLNIPTDEFVEVFVPTGFLFDAGFSISNNRHSAPDILYYADGAWMFDFDPGHAEVTRFETVAETIHVEQIDYKVERDASFSGRVRTWASMFRSLSPRNMPVDLTGFDQIVFTAHGAGITEVMLAKAGVNQWSEQFRTTINLTDKPTEYTIHFSDLVTREGLKGFTPEDVVSVIFNPIGNGNTASAFEVNVSNLHFANSSYTIASNAIFYPAYPNPFNRTTGFDLIITRDSHVKIEVLNMFGQVVEVLADQEYSIGTYKLQWHPASSRAGVYMIRMNVGSDVYTTKVIYQK